MEMITHFPSQTVPQLVFAAQRRLLVDSLAIETIPSIYSLFANLPCNSSNRIYVYRTIIRPCCVEAMKLMRSSYKNKKPWVIHYEILSQTFASDEELVEAVIRDHMRLVKFYTSYDMDDMITQIIENKVKTSGINHIGLLEFSGWLKVNLWLLITLQMKSNLI